MSFSYDKYKALTRFPGLDGIRAFACLMVVEQHLADDFLPFIDGKGGVYIFFVLSGYLITTLLIREEERYQDISIKAFYLRRTFRIFPVYYFVLGIYCALIFLMPLEEFSSKRTDMISALPLYLTYFGEFVPGETAAGFGHAWSLGIEEKFYLLWPLMGFIGISYARREWRAPLIVFMAALLLGLYLLFDIKNGFIGYYLLAVGCLLATLMNDRQWYERIRSWIGNPYSVAAVFLAFAVVYSFRHDYPAIIALFPFLVSSIIFIAVSGNGLTTAFLENRFLSYFGFISYGIYLIHILAINAVQVVIKPDGDSLFITGLIFVVSSLFSLFLAWLMHLWIEKPFIKYGRKLAGRVKRPIGQAIPSTAD